jgi:NADH:ubiquinone oxidoreductase subunit K
MNSESIDALQTKAVNTDVVARLEDSINRTRRLTLENACMVIIDPLDSVALNLTGFERYTHRKKGQALVEMAEVFGLATIFLRSGGCANNDFFAQLHDHWAQVAYVARNTLSAWDEPIFRDVLARCGAKKVLVSGCLLDICTQLLTLDLLANGYEVYVVANAPSADSAINEVATMLHMTAAGASIVSLAYVASEFAQCSDTAEIDLIGEGCESKSIPVIPGSSNTAASEVCEYAWLNSQ